MWLAAISLLGFWWYLCHLRVDDWKSVEQITLVDGLKQLRSSRTQFNLANLYLQSQRCLELHNFSGTWRQDPSFNPWVGYEHYDYDYVFSQDCYILLSWHMNWEPKSALQTATCSFSPVKQKHSPSFKHHVCSTNLFAAHAGRGFKPATTKLEYRPKYSVDGYLFLVRI